MLTQFQCPIVKLQTDNSPEFDNQATLSFLASHGIVLRLTCPYTSQQNGRAEHVLRTLNDSMRTMLLHAATPFTFWPDALAIATYLLNRRSCRARRNATPHGLLLGHDLDYSHLRVFGCLCYPNTASTSLHKLAPRSVPCIFLGYPHDTKGYRCYNPATKRVITSRHVYFHEQEFPFRTLDSIPPPTASAVPPGADAPILVVPTHPRQRRVHPPLVTTPTPAAATPSVSPCPAAHDNEPVVPELYINPCSGGSNIAEHTDATPAAAAVSSSTTVLDNLAPAAAPP